MPHAPWSLQDAKNRFSAVVQAALQGEPQVVTRRGKPAVVVLSAETYEDLRELQRAKAAPFTDLLLSMPQDDEPFNREPVRPREIDF